MTDWRAVLVGFVAGTIVAIVGFALPVIGQIGGGLVGGFVAGYLAGGGIGRGAWHGTLAGAIGGLLLGIAAAVVIALLGLAVLEPAQAALGGVGVFALAAVLALVFAIDSAIAGAIGGFLARPESAADRRTREPRP